jgi:hypothetical protein
MPNALVRGCLMSVPNTVGTAGRGHGSVELGV